MTMEGAVRRRIALTGSILIHLVMFATAGAYMNWGSTHHPRQNVYVEITSAELAAPVDETSGGGNKQPVSDKQPVSGQTGGVYDGAESKAVAASAINGFMAANGGGKLVGGHGGGPGDSTGAGRGTGSGTGDGSGPTRGPRVIDGIRPDYPESARAKGWEGTVKLQILVNKEGVVEDVRMVASSGHVELDQVAQRTVRMWRFSPALQKGVPVAAWATLPVVFNLR